METIIKITANRDELDLGVPAVDKWFNSNVVLTSQLDTQDLDWLRAVDQIKGIDGEFLVDRFDRRIQLSQISSGSKLLLTVKRIQQSRRYTTVNSDSCGLNAAILLYDFLADQMDNGIPQYAILFDTAHRWRVVDDYNFEGMMSHDIGIHDFIVAKELGFYERSQVQHR